MGWREAVQSNTTATELTRAEEERGRAELSLGFFTGLDAAVREAAIVRGEEEVRGRLAAEAERGAVMPWGELLRCAHTLSERRAAVAAEAAARAAVEAEESREGAANSAAVLRGLLDTGRQTSLLESAEWGRHAVEAAEAAAGDTLTRTLAEVGAATQAAESSRLLPAQVSGRACIGFAEAAARGMVRARREVCVGEGRGRQSVAAAEECGRLGHESSARTGVALAAAGLGRASASPTSTAAEVWIRDHATRRAHTGGREAVERERMVAAAARARWRMKRLHSVAELERARRECMGWEEALARHVSAAEFASLAARRDASCRALSDSETASREAIADSARSLLSTEAASHLRRVALFRGVRTQQLLTAVYCEEELAERHALQYSELERRQRIQRLCAAAQAVLRAAEDRKAAQAVAEGRLVEREVHARELVYAEEECDMLRVMVAVQQSIAHLQDAAAAGGLERGMVHHQESVSRSDRALSEAEGRAAVALSRERAVSV
eukprot:Hpha_TRINITY_DN31094_c0_g1::TRINITY_DN31094_c0_g1_i1::g.64090::m.64090